MSTYKDARGVEHTVTKVGGGPGWWVALDRCHGCGNESIACFDDDEPGARPFALVTAADARAVVEEADEEVDDAEKGGKHTAALLDAAALLDPIATA